MNIEAKIVAHGSPEYWMTILLRYKILRHPLKFTFKMEDLKNEKADVHNALFENDVIVACQIFTPISNATLKIRQVAVDETFQRKGFGKILQQFSEKYALENGYEKIVCNARKTAVPFYEKQGFKKIGEEFIEVGIPHFYMEKTLAF
jgi:predicted GNAT family N-acyltransferase